MRKIIFFEDGILIVDTLWRKRYHFLSNVTAVFELHFSGFQIGFSEMETKNIIFLFFLVFVILIGMTNHQHETVLRAKRDKTCYFSRQSRQSRNFLPNFTLSEIQNDCSTNGLRTFADLIALPSSKLHKSKNVADLILIRGAGEFLDFDDAETLRLLRNRHICPNHYNELYENWEDVHLKKKQKDRIRQFSV